MIFIYNSVTYIAWFFLKIIAFFSPKIKLFVTGRKEVFSILENKISKKDNYIWVHAASLGEFEQGLPIIEKLRINYPSYKILVTFFSPSGYEIKKNTTAADIVTYLPMDTKTNVVKFLDTLQPKLALFIKYEVWPNYLNELQNRTIPTLLASAIFRKSQIYFKPYGGLMRKALKNYNHIFVQNKNSLELLKSIHYTDVTITGDTRLDRVSEILERDNALDFMDSFKQNNFCLIAGSTWPEDEAILVNHINNTETSFKYVLAPHKMNKNDIQVLKKSINKKTLLYSEKEAYNIADYKVFIIDTIGLLTKIYSYANIAYVGGGFSTGLHNTLEPAVFGIPVIIGPNFKGFKEAEDLVIQKGIISINQTSDFNNTMQELLSNPEHLKKTGKINFNYITKNKGASKLILQYINTLLN